MYMYNFFFSVFSFFVSSLDYTSPSLDLTSTTFSTITCNMIFDVKMHFIRKAHFYLEGTIHSLKKVKHTIQWYISIPITALNDADIMNVDIQGNCLNVPCKEKLWSRAGD